MYQVLKILNNNTILAKKRVIMKLLFWLKELVLVKSK